MKQPHRSSPARNRGTVLVLTAALLVLITTFALFMFRSSTLELRMAGNAAARATSFESAEAARIEAETAVLPIVDNLDSGAIIYDCQDLGAGYFSTAGTGTNCNTFSAAAMDWNDADSLVSASDASARYAFEYLGVDKIHEIGTDVEIGNSNDNKIEVHVFRIVGHSIDSSGTLKSVESYFLARKS